MSCNVTLLRRESKVACVAERSFGCVDERTLWTKGCRGRFLCAGVAIACGYARHHQHVALRLGRRIECRCDSRCVEGNASAEQESLAPVTLRIEGERRRRSPAGAALVMYETRPLQRGHYWSLAAAHNERFAQQHGLAFRLYMPPDDSTSARATHGRRLGSGRRERQSDLTPWTVGCFLNGTVARATTWCKLLVVAHALQAEPIVMWLDSDAWLRPAPDPNRTIVRLLDAFRRSNDCGWFPQDEPFSATRANCGMWLWRRRGACLQLLERWWAINVKPMKTFHEQDALNGHVLTSMASASSNGVRIVPGLTPMLESSATQRSAAHVSHAHHASRWQRMCSDAVDANMTRLVPTTTHVLEVRTRAVGRAAMAPSWWRRWSSPQRTR